MLRSYGHMLSVNQVAEALNLDPRIVRTLLVQTDAQKRLPGVKIGKSWRISREQLRTYLLTHLITRALRKARHDRHCSDISSHRGHRLPRCHRHRDDQRQL
jgi:excisionase family DNA binding protein